MLRMAVRNGKLKGMGMGYCFRLLTHLCDKLHITIFDTIMNHLHIVTSTLVTNPVTAGFAITLGSNALENILDVWPRLLVSTRHQAGSISGTFLTTGDTRSHETDVFAGQIFRAAVGVREVGVTTVDDDVTIFEVGEEGLDKIVDWLSGHD